MVFLAAAVALVASQARFEGRADARLETRARTATGADTLGANSAAGDAEVTPSLWGRVDNKGGRISVRYAPTFRVREPYIGFRRTELNHNQLLEMRWAREGRPEFYLLENFYQGRVDLATQTARGAVPGFQTDIVEQLSVDLNGGVISPLSKLVKLDTSAGYFFGTGMDTFSRGFVPAQRAWRTRAELEAQLTALDTLIGGVEGTYAMFPGRDSRDSVGNTHARWRRQLLTTTRLELGLLMGYVYVHDPALPNPDFAAPAPGGDVMLSHRVNTGAHNLNLELGVRASPFIDRYLATAYERADLSSTVAYLFRERWQASVTGGVARSLTPIRQMNAMGMIENNDLWSTFVEARAGYIAPRYWQVELTGANSTFVLGNAAPVHNWLVSLSLTLHAEGQL